MLILMLYVSFMAKTLEIDVYWTVQRGERCTISLSEEAARDSLLNYYRYSDDPVGWTVERTTETVPLVLGEPFTTNSELIDMQTFQTINDRIAAPHVGWDCPHCGEHHTTDLCDDAECKEPPATSPQLWFCERGCGMVIVEW
jgi:hypothetical protein